jgi:hypothetical protein
LSVGSIRILEHEGGCGVHVGTRWGKEAPMQTSTCGLGAVMLPMNNSLLEGTIPSHKGRRIATYL